MILSRYSITSSSNCSARFICHLIFLRWYSLWITTLLLSAQPPPFGSSHLSSETNRKSIVMPSDKYNNKPWSLSMMITQSNFWFTSFHYLSAVQVEWSTFMSWRICHWSILSLLTRDLITMRIAISRRIIYHKKIKRHFIIWWRTLKRSIFRWNFPFKLKKNRSSAWAFFNWMRSSSSQVRLTGWSRSYHSKG